ncbi:MAG: primosomal protein N' [Gammaproteobacteria bacterium]|nr:primosomal protein N' [Gammaproteobacteria bacterium]
MENSDGSLILQVAIDTPLRRTFDYLAPVPAAATPAGSPRARPGVRVRVPFGRTTKIGIVVAVTDRSTMPRAKLKHAGEIIDCEPLFDPVGFELLRWAADYYHHPIGEVLAAALPAALRDGRSLEEPRLLWEPTPLGLAEATTPSDRRAPTQRALLAHLCVIGPRTTAELGVEFDPAILRAVATRGWIRERPQPALPADVPPGVAPVLRSSSIELTDAQRLAVDRIVESGKRFAVHLLHGVTGSGKTEVYLRAIAGLIGDHGQALVLVPEISLTPQLVERFRQRFDSAPAILHSGLAAGERLDAWRRARSGEARIVIGTRSAVLVPLPRLALIIVDEEHDASYKQHEGFRYSARDLAVVRARRADVAIVLGSATPSLESLENAIQGRYRKLMLPERPGAARAARMRLVDLRRHAVDHGFSQPAIAAIATHLAAGAQVIVFQNRRGYAPTLFCAACGWVATCAHCDARLTLHRHPAGLRCHHCGAQRPPANRCEACGRDLHPVGQGTERIEETLGRLFPGQSIARLDRDTVTTRGAIDALLERVRSGDARILVGTQMLTKGHDFPEIGLVVILDADQGLFATDYRAAERLAQTIIQVAGRAGRATRPGEVLIQTEFPDHPLLRLLIDAGYEAFAAQALAERREARWPPYARLALLRADAKDPVRLDAFLCAASRLAQATAVERSRGVSVLGPANALIARRADRHRAHLLIEAGDRSSLQRFLGDWLPRVESLSAPHGLRWSLDVDPLEVD